ncbi:MAG: helix-hairpin-helix domain-containing protein [Pseudomonadota bacterium]
MRFILALVIGFGALWWFWNRASKADAQAASSTPAPASEPEAEPSPEPGTQSPGKEPKPNIAAAVGEPDDLTRIKGIGPKLNAMCHSLGIRRFDQIAAWSDTDIAEVDRHLKVKGRIVRDRWVDQAKMLAVGDDAAHRAEFGS